MNKINHCATHGPHQSASCPTCDENQHKVDVASGYIAATDDINGLFGQSDIGDYSLDILFRSCYLSIAVDAYLNGTDAVSSAFRKKRIRDYISDKIKAYHESKS